MWTLSADGRTVTNEDGVVRVVKGTPTCNAPGCDNSCAFNEEYGNLASGCGEPECTKKIKTAKAAAQAAKAAAKATAQAAKHRTKEVADQKVEIGQLKHEIGQLKHELVLQGEQYKAIFNVLVDAGIVKTTASFSADAVEE